MDQTKPAAERVRGILQAMERSIDSARRRRLHDADVVSTPAPAAAPTAPTHAAVASPTPGGRLKARPKRSPGPGFSRPVGVG